MYSCIQCGFSTASPHDFMYHTHCTSSDGTAVFCSDIKPSSLTKIESKGTKHDDGKVPMELLSHNALKQIAEVFGFGKKKYGEYNYRKGLEWGRLIGAAYRHLGAFNSGEDKDPETNLSHIAHLACTAIMLLDMIADHPELDTRYKPDAKAPKTE